jgi:hypothetical protein
MFVIPPSPSRYSSSLKGNVRDSSKSFQIFIQPKRECLWFLHVLPDIHLAEKGMSVIPPSPYRYSSILKGNVRDSSKSFQIFIQPKRECSWIHQVVTDIHPALRGMFLIPPSHYRYSSSLKGNVRGSSKSFQIFIQPKMECPWFLQVLTDIHPA